LPTLENNGQIVENRNRIKYKKVYLKAQVKKGLIEPTLKKE